MITKRLLSSYSFILNKDKWRPRITNNTKNTRYVFFFYMLGKILPYKLIQNSFSTFPFLCLSTNAWTILTFGVSVTQSRRSHVTQSYCPLAAAIDEGVAVMRMEFCSCNHFCQLFHVCWFYIYNI